MYFPLVVLLTLLSPLRASPAQVIKVRENVNVTMTCHLQSAAGAEARASPPTVPSLSSFNKVFDQNPSGNIILWYKDDTQVIGVNSISNDPQKYVIIQENFHTYQLILLNVQLESSGVYKCQNFTAKEENRFQLNVMVPPSRLRLNPTPRLPVADGTSVQFDCTSERAYPTPTFEWYKNDQLIQRSIGISNHNQTGAASFSSSSILTLLLSPADHDQILRCQVTNEASIHDTNVELKLDVLFKPIINLSWNQKESPIILSVIENTFESVHCAISANPSALAHIEWFKNDQLIPGEHQEQLKVNFTRFEDVQKLTCRARNTIGQSEASVNVDILYKPKLSMIEHVTLNQGERLVLRCSIDSNPLCHHVRWFHHQQEVFAQPCAAANRTHMVSEYTVPKVSRIHSGRYTCEAKNWLNTGGENRHEATAEVSTDVRIQYAPFILNSIKKLAVVENQDITTECLVDAHPKADITWFGPAGQRLSSFAEEKVINATVTSSQLHLPPSYSTMLGLYRCVAKNQYGQHDFAVQFQRPGLPDPPMQLQAVNVTHASFVLTWHDAYNGGSNVVYHISLSGNRSEERQTSLNSMRFTDLTEKSRYAVKIRSKNELGFSDYSTSVVVLTSQCPFSPDEFPAIQRAYYTVDGRRIRFHLSEIRSPLVSKEQLCIQHYHTPSSAVETTDEFPPCVPLTAVQLSNDELEIVIDQPNIRVKLCLINQTDVCSKSITVPTGVALSGDASELILILIGAILGLCVVAGLIGLFVCIQQRRRKGKSKHGSTDTLKTNSNGGHMENFHATPVRVVDTNSCLYYPAQTSMINEVRPNGTLFYNPEVPNSIYTLQDKKNSMCFDSGMPSTTSDNSDSACSHGFSSSDLDGHAAHGFYERSDGEHLMHARLSSKKALLPDIQQLFLAKFNGSTDVPPYTAGEPHSTLRVSSEEESGFSTPTKSHHGKKLVYEVVV